MGVIEVSEFGGPEVLAIRDRPQPQPGSDQVRIDVEVVEIIYLDTQLRSGWGTDFFPMRPAWVPGTGVAGRIAAVGDGVDSARIGTRVIARTGDEGGYAEQVVVPVGQVWDVPDGLALDVATGALHDGVLALHQLNLADLPSGGRVLITAAAGSAGHWLVPLARAAGATVVGAAGGPHKSAVVRELGADVSTDYRGEQWPPAAGADFDAVFDGAGGEVGRAALDLLRPGGVFLGYGAASGAFAASAGRDDIRYVGLVDAGQADWAELTPRSLALLADGTVRPRIGQRVPFAEAARAHQAIADRTVVGKSVLIV